MQIKITFSIFCGLLLISTLNSRAAPIDQTSYLDNGSYQTERREKTWADGRQYDGEWLNGKPHGQGMFTYADGAQYWGRFNMGKRQGEGMMKFTNGDEYEGNWFDDQPNGTGKMRFASGGDYEGEFSNGEKSGKGRQAFVDGTYYDGQWMHNVPHGYGRLTFISGGAYEGLFQQGKPHGKGQYFYANGDLYDGEWQNGQPQGIGRFDYGTGGFYEGQVADGRRQGQGVWVTALGKRYEGPFINNQPDGQGRCGTRDKMAPCTYRKGKRTESSTAVAAAPPAKATASAQPTGGNKAITASVAAATTVAIATQQPGVTVITPATASVQPASRTQSAPVQNPSLSTAGPNHQIKSAIPSIKPVTPAPITGAPFVATLQNEKQNLKKTSVTDLDQDRSDISFQDNWEGKNLQSGTERVWWNKQVSLFQDKVEIISQHGDTRIRMVLGSYKGPGHYKLDEVVVEAPGNRFTNASTDIAVVDIQKEENGWLSGTFKFRVSADSGQHLEFSDGVFRIATAEKQPRFLR